MQEPTNPYATPVTALADHSPGLVDKSRYAAVGEVVVMWEKLRFLYNAIMIPFAILVFAMMFLTTRAVMQSPLGILPIGGIFANLCFCAAPLVDGYLTWFGFRHRYITAFLFVCGTVSTMLLATFVLAFAPLI